MPIASDVILGENVVIFHKDLVNLYGCRVGASTKIGTFVEIQKGAVIGQRCKISSHTFVCEGVTIEDDVFVGHGVVFINDPRPRATIHGPTQAELASISVCTRRTSTDVVHRPCTPAAPSREHRVHDDVAARDIRVGVNSGNARASVAASDGCSPTPLRK